MFVDLNLAEIIKKLKIKDQYGFSITKRKHRRHLVKNVIKVIHEHDIKHTENEYRRAIGNACHHGQSPIHCEMYVGTKGEFVCVIRDSGEGFDYKDIVEKYKRKEKYFHGHGYGMRAMGRNKHLDVGWEDGGRAIALLYNL